MNFSWIFGIFVFCGFVRSSESRNDGKWFFQKDHGRASLTSSPSDNYYKMKSRHNHKQQIKLDNPRYALFTIRPPLSEDHDRQKSGDFLFKHLFKNEYQNNNQNANTQLRTTTYRIDESATKSRLDLTTTENHNSVMESTTIRNTVNQSNEIPTFYEIQDISTHPTYAISEGSPEPDLYSSNFYDFSPDNNDYIDLTKEHYIHDVDTTPTIQYFFPFWQYSSANENVQTTSLIPQTTTISNDENATKTAKLTITESLELTTTKNTMFESNEIPTFNESQETSTHYIYTVSDELSEADLHFSNFYDTSYNEGVNEHYVIDDVDTTPTIQYLFPFWQYSSANEYVKTTASPKPQTTTIRKVENATKTAELTVTESAELTTTKNTMSNEIPTFNESQESSTYPIYAISEGLSEADLLFSNFYDTVYNEGVNEHYVIDDVDTTPTIQYLFPFWPYSSANENLQTTPSTVQQIYNIVQSFGESHEYYNSNDEDTKSVTGLPVYTEITQVADSKNEINSEEQENFTFEYTTVTSNDESYNQTETIDLDTHTEGSHVINTVIVIEKSAEILPKGTLKKQNYVYTGLEATTFESIESTMSDYLQPEFELTSFKNVSNNHENKSMVSPQILDETESTISSVFVDTTEDNEIETNTETIVQEHFKNIDNIINIYIEEEHVTDSDIIESTFIPNSLTSTLTPNENDQLKNSTIQSLEDDYNEIEKSVLKISHEKVDINNENEESYNFADTTTESHSHLTTDVSKHGNINANEVISVTTDYISKIDVIKTTPVIIDTVEETNFNTEANIFKGIYNISEGTDLQTSLQNSSESNLTDDSDFDELLEYSDFRNEILDQDESTISPIDSAKSDKIETSTTQGIKTDTSGTESSYREINIILDANKEEDQVSKYVNENMTPSSILVRLETEPIDQTHNNAININEFEKSVTTWSQITELTEGENYDLRNTTETPVIDFHGTAEITTFYSDEIFEISQNQERRINLNYSGDNNSIEEQKNYEKGMKSSQVFETTTLGDVHEIKTTIFGEYEDTTVTVIEKNFDIESRFLENDDTINNDYDRKGVQSIEEIVVDEDLTRQNRSCDNCTKNDTIIAVTPTVLTINLESSTVPVIDQRSRRSDISIQEDSIDYYD